MAQPLSRTMSFLRKLESIMDPRASREDDIHHRNDKKTSSG